MEEIYGILGEALRIVMVSEKKLANVGSAKLYAYRKPSAEVQLMFKEELQKEQILTEFAYGNVRCYNGANAARENLKLIFEKLPKLPDGQEYGFERDVVFTLPMPKQKNDGWYMNISPWIKAKLEEE